MKKLVIACMVIIMSISTATAAWAGAWKTDSHGKWWQNDDGSWPANCWQWIDDNNDGVSECYYFDSNGYLFTGSKTPDNYPLGYRSWWADESGYPILQKADPDYYCHNLEAKYGNNIIVYASKGVGCGSYYEFQATVCNFNDHWDDDREEHYDIIRIRKDAVVRDKHASGIPSSDIQLLTLDEYNKGQQDFKSARIVSTVEYPSYPSVTYDENGYIIAFSDDTMAE